jgi:hypothetical protein
VTADLGGPVADLAADVGPVPLDDHQDEHEVEPLDLGERRLERALAGLVDEIEHEHPAEVVDIDTDDTSHIRAPSRSLTTTSTIPRGWLFPPASRKGFDMNGGEGWRRAEPGEIERQYEAP